MDASYVQDGFGVWAENKSRRAFYIGDFRKGCFHGKGFLQYFNGDNNEAYEPATQNYWELLQYEGDWKHGLADGKGKLVWCDGHQFIGDFKQDERCGRGMFVFPDGRYYRGVYQGDERNGPGSFHWPNGDYWEGIFFNMTSARGVKTIAVNNIQIRGEWRGLALEDGVGEMELRLSDRKTVIKGIYRNEVFIPYQLYHITVDKLYQVINTAAKDQQLDLLSSAPSSSTEMESSERTKKRSRNEQEGESTEVRDDADTEESEEKKKKKYKLTPGDVV
eukprot:TRINITY_DN2726_c0_g1_i2.p1 TRINITY_DN2726_c0_g1~~TRINITY_DN2726_c0_g1_i2.p1  ORF type:complete len:308 (+),score=40.47 TRINITY_DN2726_c0_g1_i2:97-924(+)